MPANREADTKHGVTFWLCKAYDLPDNLEYYLIRANEEILSQIGANVFGQGARFPGLENGVKQFPYNDDARAKLQYIGLELMGAYVLSFTSNIDNSPDASYHLTWQPDAVDKGHWNIELLVPSDVDTPAITSVEAETLDCGESATLSLVDGVLHLGIPRGCDGTDGSNGIDGTDGTDGIDGREIELRISGGYIQWRYVGDVGWTNLLATATLKGDKGDTGDTGPKGDTGEIGDMGLQGIQGETGPQGEQGEPGDPCDNCPPTTDTTTATTGEDVRCNVAAGVAAWAASKFTDTIAAFDAKISEFTVISDSISAMVGLIPLTGDIISYYIQTLQDIFAAGISTTTAAFTTEFKEDVLCQLYCLVGTGGALTDTVISSWQDAVQGLAGYGTFAATYAKFLRSMLNDNFRRIALIYQHVPGACGCTDCLTDCPDGCTWKSVYIGSFSGWFIVNSLGAIGTDIHTTLTGGVDYEVRAQINFSATTIKRVKIKYSNSNMLLANGDAVRMWDNTARSGTKIYGSPTTLPDHASVVNQVDIFDMNAVGAQCLLLSMDNYLGASASFTEITICGTGVKPSELA